MTLFKKTALAAALFALGTPVALAQTSATPGATRTPAEGGASAGQSSPGSGLRMPYQRDFWGHAGVSLGRSDADTDCPAGGSCDFKDNAWRVYGGGRFNNALGGEIAYTNFGDFDYAGGELDAHAVDFALIAGIPFAQNWSIFGKVGLAYSQAEVRGNTLASVQNGKQHAWGPRFGFGLQMGLTENWALRADLDRYRIKIPSGSRESIDTFMLGAQYTFR